MVQPTTLNLQTLTTSVFRQRSMWLQYSRSTARTSKIGKSLWNWCWSGPVAALKSDLLSLRPSVIVP